MVFVIKSPFFRKTVFFLNKTIKRKIELEMSWDREELWWVIILKAIPHLILKKALQEFFFLFTENFGKNKRFQQKI